MPKTEGWKKLSHDRGYVNEATGQTLAIRKKEFGEHYAVWLSSTESGGGNQEEQKLSPDFPTLAKADAFAAKWLQNNPNGTSQSPPK
jgi:hypothetical protein